MFRSPYVIRVGAVLLLGVLAPASGAAPAPLPGFQLDGTRWTYRDGRTTMEGILMKPEGEGPFPALLVSHGRGGNAQGFGTVKAREFVKMGFVCIAPTYTHAGPDPAARAGTRGEAPERKGRAAAGGKSGALPAGAPGSPDGPGASDENLRRAARCLDILASLPYVDAGRLAAYGNSMGAFVTVGLSAQQPSRLKAAAITAGGVWGRAGSAAEAQARAARVPLCILHGSSDTTVPPESSARLKALLDANNVPNERHVFEGIGHNLHQQKADEVNRHIRAWFTRFGVLEEK
jgi:dienelactone hydrolase